MIPIHLTRTKAHRKAQNPWPKDWNFSTLNNFTIDFNLEFQLRYFSKKLLPCLIDTEATLSLIKIKNPKNLKALAFKDIKPHKRVIQRLKHVRTLLINGNTRMKQNFTHLQKIIISDVYNAKGKPLCIRALLRRNKGLSMLMLKNINDNYIRTILKAFRPLKEPGVLHLRFKNDYIVPDFSSLVSQLKGIKELRIELKRISIGQKKIVQLFRGLSTLKKLRCIKLDIYDLTFLNQVNLFTDLSKELNELYSKMSSIDIRISQNIQIQLPVTVEYLKHIDFLAVNMKLNVPYGKLPP